MENVKQKAREMFDDKLGYLKQFILSNNDFGERDYESIKSFIDQIIDLAIAEREKEVIEKLKLGIELTDEYGRKWYIKEYVDLLLTNSKK